MIDFIIENVFSLIADMSVEKIKELRSQYSNQHILFMTAKQFFSTDEFKREFPDVTTVLNKDAILAIPSIELEVLKTVDEIKKSITPVFDSMVITDDSEVKHKIIHAIALQFRSKRNLTINLFEVIEEQRKDTEIILEKIRDVDKKSLYITDSIVKREALKEEAVKSGIGRKMAKLVGYAAQSYIMIVTKKPAQIIGKDTAFHTGYIQGVRKQIEDDLPGIDINFLHSPIISISPAPNGSLIPLRKEVNVLQFLWTFRLELNSQIDDLLKYSNFLPDSFVISMISLGNIVDEDLNSHAIEWGVSEMLVSAKQINPEQYVKGLKAYYRKLGEQICSMAEYVFR